MCCKVDNRCRLCVISEVRSTTGCRLCVVSEVRSTTGVGCVMSVR